MHDLTPEDMGNYVENHERLKRIHLDLLHETGVLLQELAVYREVDKKLASL